jgi:hypothetical protein
MVPSLIKKQKMDKRNTFYPTEENLGHNCQYWDWEEGCLYPKAELTGRRSCEGMIDDVCLFVLEGLQATSLSEAQVDEIINRAPNLLDKSYLPPGNVT